MTRLILILEIFCIGCVSSVFGKLQNYPEPLQNSFDIWKTSADIEMISIGSLPIKLYPKLVKFQKVWQVKFAQRDGTGADNERLKEFAKLFLPLLRDVNLLNCPLVGDEGIRALCAFGTIKYLQLEGSGITDISCKEMANTPNLKGVNVSRCSNVTLAGLTALAESNYLEDMGISVDKQGTEEVADLLRKFCNIKRIEIVDIESVLDKAALNEVARQKGIKLLIRPDGALEYFKK